MPAISSGYTEKTAAVKPSKAPSEPIAYATLRPTRLPRRAITNPSGRPAREPPVLRHTAANAPLVSLPVISSPKRAHAEKPAVIANPAGTTPLCRTRIVWRCNTATSPRVSVNCLSILERWLWPIDSPVYLQGSAGYFRPVEPLSVFCIWQSLCRSVQ